MDTPKEIIEERCKTVLKYLFPNYTEMSVRQYQNAMEALRSIHYGTPNGKKIKENFKSGY